MFVLLLFSGFHFCGFCLSRSIKENGRGKKWLCTEVGEAAREGEEAARRLRGGREKMC